VREAPGVADMEFISEVRSAGFSEPDLDVDGLPILKSWSISGRQFAFVAGREDQALESFFPIHRTERLSG
jgi:hypothetical protein